MKFDTLPLIIIKPVRMLEKLPKLILTAFLSIAYLHGQSQDNLVFYYKAELKSKVEQEDQILLAVDLPDLISGLYLVIDKQNADNNTCTWSDPRGVNELKIDAKEIDQLIFPEGVPENSIVMIGIDRPKDFINIGKHYFMDVTFYGFRIVNDPFRK